MVETGLVFAMVFVLILLGFLIAVGFTQIRSFFCLGSDAQTVKAVKDIDTLAEEVAVLSKGSAKAYQLALPGDAKLCFLNATNPGPRPWPSPDRTWNPDPLILDNFLRNPGSLAFGSNLWIHSCGKPFGEGYRLKRVAVRDSFCAYRGDSILLEQTGAAVRISI